MGTSSGATCSWPGCDQPPTWGQIESGVWTRLCAVHLHPDLERHRLSLDPTTSEASSAPAPDEGETSSDSKRLTARWRAWTEGVVERNRAWTAGIPERNQEIVERVHDLSNREYLERRQVNTEGLSRVALRETVRREEILEREEREQQQDERDREYLERKLNLMVKSGVVSADEIEGTLGVDGTEGLSRVKLREITNLLRQEQRVEFWTAVGQGVVTMAASSNTQSNWQRNFDPKPMPESYPQQQEQARQAAGHHVVQFAGCPEPFPETDWPLRR